VSVPDVSREGIESALRRSPVLKEASDAAIQALAAGTHARSLRRGELFLHEGIVPDHFGIVLSGHVRAVHFNHEGRPITLLVGWPGDSAGLMTLLAKRPAEADIEAAEPSRIAVVPRATLEAVLSAEPRLALSLLSDCTRQLFDMAGTVKTLSVDVMARVANAVLHRVPPAARKRGGGCPKIDLGVSRVELAAELGTVPETLSRAFAALSDEGVIASDGRIVTVLDMDALAAHACGEARV
jgi:CRP/FNR family transcriptional regulator